MALPLEGIRILDNGIVQAGTFPSRLLADFGAEIVRVENYARPDLSRNAVFPNGAARDPYWENGGTYHEQHRNKTYCIGLDVRKPEGRDAFLRLAKVSDIVMDSHPPGVMDKLDLDYESLRVLKPDMIYISTSGYGYGGPFSAVRSYGMMTEIMCGSAWLNGYEGEEPRRGACPLTDHPSTYHGAFIMMAALIRRQKTGKGMWIDMSQYEIAINVLGDAHVANAIGAPVPERIGSIDPGVPFSGCFKCDGFERWITLAVTSHEGWRSLCGLLGQDALAGRDVFAQPLSADERDAFAAAVTAWTSARDTSAAFAALTAAGVPAGPVNDIRDLLLDPHLEARGYFWLVDHAPEQNVGRRAWPGASAVLSETPGEFMVRAPMLGEHNRQIATGLLGYSPAEYAALEESGVFGTIPLAADMKPPPVDVAARPTLNPAAAGRSKLYDPEHLDRLTARFGPGYGQ